MRLIDAAGHHHEGEIRFDGKDLLTLLKGDVRHSRFEIGMIFQDPMTSTRR